MLLVQITNRPRPAVAAVAPLIHQRQFPDPTLPFSNCFMLPGHSGIRQAEQPSKWQSRAHRPFALDRRVTVANDAGVFR
jgi:hypothetical protein